MGHFVPMTKVPSEHKGTRGGGRESCPSTHRIVVLDTVFPAAARGRNKAGRDPEVFEMTWAERAAIKTLPNPAALPPPSQPKTGGQVRRDSRLGKSHGVLEWKASPSKLTVPSPFTSASWTTSAISRAVSRSPRSLCMACRSSPRVISPSPLVSN